MTTIRLESPAFTEGGAIPRKYTCDGDDVSPPLAWSGVPEAARSLALVCDDPDAPRGTWSHWVVFDIAPTIVGIPEGVPPEASLRLDPDHLARQGHNDFRKTGYGGPCPPSGTHRYVFHLYALDAPPDVPNDATRPQLLRAIEGHILAEGRLTGRYTRAR